MRKDVGSTQGTAPLVCRAEDQQAGPVAAWTVASESESGPVRQAGGRGAAGTRYLYIAILHTKKLDIENDIERGDKKAAAGVISSSGR